MTPFMAALGLSGGEMILVFIVMMTGLAVFGGLVILLIWLATRKKDCSPKVCPHCGKDLIGH